MRSGAYEGSILGLAIGDALGFPAEFRRREQILAAFGEEGLVDFVALHDPRWPPRPHIASKAHPAGTFSDDTQMTIALAEALLEADDDLDAQMNAIARRFVAWSSSDDNDRAPGNACMTGCHALARGVPWREAGVADSKGCGSAMRVAPIGLLWHDDLERVLAVARAQAVLTHRHDAGVEGAAAAALLVALAMQDRTPEEMYEAVARECSPRSRDFAACWSKLPAMRDAPPEHALSARGLGEGWLAEEAVASAFYCVWRTPDDFARVVTTAATTDGDSDSLACIAGSIAGARLGSDAIPEKWRRGVEGADALVDLARRIAATSERRPRPA
ncbi:MAG TPA: ADP-ribosylglycohydrolase family protein [Polyangiaceae bacterium]|jgi:ADP-ribosylglycohydrolase